MIFYNDYTQKNLRKSVLRLTVYKCVEFVDSTF